MRFVLGILGALVLTAPVFADPPVNDDILGAIRFGLGFEDSITLTGTLAGATRTVNDVTPAGVVGPTVWWQLDPRTGPNGESEIFAPRTRYRIQIWVDDQPANFAYYTGDRRLGLDLRDFHRASDGEEGIVVSNWAVGETDDSYIAVTAENPSPGDIRMVVSRLDFLINDDFADAREVTGERVLDLVTTHGATYEATLACDTELVEPGYGTVWWRWTAPRDGRFGAATYWAEPNATNPIAAMRVFTSNEVGGLSEVAAGRTSSDRFRASFDARSGREYHFCANNFSSQGRMLTFRLGPSPVNTTPEDAIDLTGTVGYIHIENFFQTETAWYRYSPVTSDTFTAVSYPNHGADFARFYRVFPGGVTERICLDVQGELTAGCELIAGLDYLIEARSVRQLRQLHWATGLWGFTWSYGDRVDPQIDVDTGRARFAVLPNVRAPTLPTQGTYFATVINPTSDPFVGCTLAAIASPPGTVASWRLTDPSTNEAFGYPNAPFSIPPGGVTTLVFRSDAGWQQRPSAPYGSALELRCINGPSFNPNVPDQYVNRFINAPSLPLISDIIAIGSTFSADGVVRVPTGRRTAFSMAAVNIGFAETIRVAPEVTFDDPDLHVEICETNPATGACLSSRSSSVTVDFAANEVRTFSLFVGDDDTSDLQFRPINRRIMVFFTTPEGFARGGASVAVTAAE